MPFDIEKFIPQRSTERFYVPLSIQDDFRKLVYTDMPNLNFTFTIVHDWFNQEDIFDIRGKMFPIAWKANQNNADETGNFRTHLGVDIRKGDIFRRDDNEDFLCVWAIDKEINNLKTQAQGVNILLTITRYQERVIDNKGKLVVPGGYATVFSDLPTVGYETRGKYEFVVASYVPGIVPNNIKTLLIQYNSLTVKLRLNDQFLWKEEAYKIVNLDYSQVSFDQKSGIIVANCEKVPGEQLHA